MILYGFMYGKRKEDFMFEDAENFMFPKGGNSLIFEEYRNLPWTGMFCQKRNAAMSGFCRDAREAPNFVNDA